MMMDCVTCNTSCHARNSCVVNTTWTAKGTTLLLAEKAKSLKAASVLQKNMSGLPRDDGLRDMLHLTSRHAKLPRPRKRNPAKSHLTVKSGDMYFKHSKVEVSYPKIPIIGPSKNKPFRK